MAVYTEVSDDELAAFIAEYDIGTAVSCKGIAEGVENSNYLLLTEGGPYILTLYEKRVDARDLPFFLGLIEHLAARGVPCPVPVHGRDGAVLRTLCERPAAITSFLAGVWPRRPRPEHCAELGEALARMHLAGLDYEPERANALSVDSWRPLFERCRAGADDVAPASRPRFRRPSTGSRRFGHAICRAAWSTPISSPTTSSSSARSSAA